jgi:lipoprotein-anchoring transpeptidase ErfK/SrfK
MAFLVAAHGVVHALALRLIRLKERGFSMHSRLLAAVLLSSLLPGFATIAPAQNLGASDDRYSGGQTTGRRYELFGGMSYVGAIKRETVQAPGGYAPGTIIVNTSERRLYLIQDNGTALKYGIGVGRVGFTWAGVTKVVAKKEWPDWTPPSQMLKRRPDLPRFMKGGPENPLGARAMYLGASLYRIHGSNEPETIGQAVSSGCFRLMNDDVVDLYSRVKVGAKVIVMR